MPASFRLLPAVAARVRHAAALHRRGDLTEAERLFREILAEAPDCFDAVHLSGVIAAQRGRLAEAERLFARALSIDPGSAEAHNNRGIVLQALRRFDEALASYDCALAIKPDNAEVLNSRGIVLTELQRFDAALASHDRALAIRPDYATALNCRGNVLRYQKKFGAALASYDRALAIQPDVPEPLCNRGIVLRELKRLDESLASYDRALAVRPDYADALNSRGIVLRELGRLDKALACVDRALAIRPNFAEALTSRGTTLIELHRLDEALASLRQAQAVRPGYADAHWGESLCHLLAGDLAAGFSKYEWRWRTDQATLRKFSQPLWLGEPDVAGKTILLHAEQGLGDTIQFCRYAPMLAERGARVVLEVQPALKSLMSSLNGVQVVARDEPMSELNFHCPLLSLPLACGTTIERIPGQVPYLSPAPALVRNFHTRLPTSTPLIGLAWSGNPQHGNDRNRSIALQRLAPLLDCGATLVSLQQAPCDDDRAWLAAHPAVLQFGDFSDFANTAALISLLDLVISVDTSVAHLAGAMATPVWILLPAIGLDWRWMLRREDSPWYPSARLFRQQATSEWDSVIDRVAGEVRALFGARA